MKLEISMTLPRQDVCLLWVRKNVCFGHFVDNVLQSINGGSATHCFVQFADGARAHGKKKTNYLLTRPLIFHPQ